MIGISGVWRPTRDEWSARWLAMASLVATWSKDPSTQVGCVIVNDMNHVVSTGYNGFARMVPDYDHKLKDRLVKYEMAVHAEANALLQAGSRSRGATAYVTHPPCARCMGMLINSGIIRIVTKKQNKEFMGRWADSLTLSTNMAGEANIQLLVLDK